MPRRLLVTGGAGFVGSHVVLALVERGDAVVVLDDLRLGHRAAVVAGAELVVGDAGDPALLAALLRDRNWDAVLHFAALSQVGESMAEPLRYLDENVGVGLRLIRACVAHRVRHFVLSSTAALFGRSAALPIAEDAPIDPGSPVRREQAVPGAGAVLGGSHPRSAQRLPALFQRRRRRPRRTARRGPPAGDAPDPARDRRRPRPATEAAGVRRRLPDPGRHRDP